MATVDDSKWFKLLAEYEHKITTGEKQATPTGEPLEPWEGQVEITPEDVAEALRDWDAKAPPKARGLLLTERPTSG